MTVKFEMHPAPIDGVRLFQPKAFRDERGYSMETYNQEELCEVGFHEIFVQDNQTLSKRGVVRGMHFQRRHPQGKLVRAIRGVIFDAVVDLRRGSPTFGRSFGVELSDENRLQIYVPPGFAHGFLVLSDEALVQYKCTDFYRPGDEGGILWNDPALGIAWPLERIGGAPILSAKDAALAPLDQTDLGF